MFMYKTVGVAVLTLATFAFTSGSKPADASPNSPSSPVIVARVNLTGQSAAIPTTTLFTPAKTGLYRTTTYLAVTQRGDGQAYWEFNLGWPDDAGAETANPIENVDNAKPPTSYANGYSNWPGAVVAFKAVAGVPVTYSVSSAVGTLTGTFELCIVVERLE
jgi:hypothetical protein